MKEIISTLHNNQAGSLYSVAAVTALLLLCGASLQAQSASTQSTGKEKEKLSKNIPTQTPESNFAKLDLDHNRKLSREEVAGDKSLASKFDMLDLNVDGTLDVKEYEEFTSVVQKK